MAPWSLCAFKYLPLTLVDKTTTAIKIGVLDQPVHCLTSGSKPIVRINHEFCKIQTYEHVCQRFLITNITYMYTYRDYRIFYSIYGVVADILIMKLSVRRPIIILCTSNSQCHKGSLYLYTHYKIAVIWLFERSAIISSIALRVNMKSRLGGSCNFGIFFNIPGVVHLNIEHSWCRLFKPYCIACRQSECLSRRLVRI